MKTALLPHPRLDIPGIVFPFDGMPAAGDTYEVAPGVYWLRMPLPFALDHINLWLLEDNDSWTLVDMGLANAETKAIWESIFTRLAIDKPGGKPVSQLIVTHFHPDHMGLGGWLSERFGVDLTMPRMEWLMARMLFLDVEMTNHDAQIPFYVEHGLSADVAEKMFAGRDTYRNRVTAPPVKHLRIRAGDTLEINGVTWEILVGTGHSPEHACLYSAELKVMIAGDQILPKITPNIGVWPNEPEADPLADYLSTLPQFKRLHSDTLVLPSHNYPFRGLHARVDQLIEHHEVRLDRLRKAVSDAGSTTTELVPALFNRTLDTYQMGFAVSETLAHLSLLVRRREIGRKRDSDGLLRFRRKAA